MGKLRACLVIGIVAVAACGSSSGKKTVDAQTPDSAPDAKVFLDAMVDAPPMFDFSCSGNSAPTTADAMVTISGTATEVGVNGNTPSFSPLVGATADACKGNCTGPNKLATATTDAQGAFSDGPITTGGTPLIGDYLKLTPPNGSMDKSVLEYPAEPVTTNLMNIPLFTLTPQAVTLLGFVGCQQDFTTKGMLAVLVTDCTNKPINDSANITITVMQNGTALTVTPIDLGAVSQMAAGTFLICNVPANATTTVGATYKTMTLLAHDVNVAVNTITASQIRPGY